MNFSIAKEKFSHLLYLTTSIVERKNTMPILANVKLTAEGNKLSVSATDLQISLVGEAEANVTAPGSITVDAKVLYDIVRELPDEAVTVTLAKSQRLEIQCGKSRYKINGASSDEYPSIAGTLLQNPISIEAAVFYEMFDKTSFAVSTDETRFNINGVYVEAVTNEQYPGRDCIRFVATDGHRMALIDRPADGLVLNQTVIIPRKGIQEIKKVLEGNQGAAELEIMEGFFTVRSTNVTIGVRLAEGEFPDYRQVIPKEFNCVVEADREELFSAVKRASVVTTDKVKAVRFRIEEDALVLTSSSPEYGEATESVSITKKGENLTVGFSARYVMELLGYMAESETISLKLNGELGPGCFFGSNNPEFTCVVMPMRFE